MQCAWQNELLLSPQLAIRHTIKAERYSAAMEQQSRCVMDAQFVDLRTCIYCASKVRHKAAMTEGDSPTDCSRAREMSGGCCCCCCCCQPAAPCPTASCSEIIGDGLNLDTRPSGGDEQPLLAAAAASPQRMSHCFLQLGNLQAQFSSEDPSL